jgi:hypothetical protein
MEVSFSAQRDDRIGAGSASRRNPAGKKRDTRQQE